VVSVPVKEEKAKQEKINKKKNQSGGRRRRREIRTHLPATLEQIARHGEERAKLDPEESALRK